MGEGICFCGNGHFWEENVKAGRGWGLRAGVGDGGGVVGVCVCVCVCVCVVGGGGFWQMRQGIKCHGCEASILALQVSEMASRVFRQVRLGFE